MNSALNTNSGKDAYAAVANAMQDSTGSALKNLKSSGYYSDSEISQAESLYSLSKAAGIDTSSFYGDHSHDNSSVVRKTIGSTYAVGNDFDGYSDTTKNALEEYDSAKRLSTYDLMNKDSWNDGDEQAAYEAVNSYRDDSKNNSAYMAVKNAIAKDTVSDLWNSPEYTHDQLDEAYRMVKLGDRVSPTTYANNKVWNTAAGDAEMILGAAPSAILNLGAGAIDELAGTNIQSDKYNQYTKDLLDQLGRVNQDSDLGPVGNTVNSVGENLALLALGGGAAVVPSLSLQGAGDQARKNYDAGSDDISNFLSTGANFATGYALNSWLNPVANGVGSVIEGAGNNAAQAGLETLSDSANDLIMDAVNNRSYENEQAPRTFSDLAKNTAQSALSGGISGGILGGINPIIGNVSGNTNTETVSPESLLDESSISLDNVQNTAYTNGENTQNALEVLSDGKQYASDPLRPGIENSDQISLADSTDSGSTYGQIDSANSPIDDGQGNGTQTQLGTNAEWAQAVTNKGLKSSHTRNVRTFFDSVDSGTLSESSIKAQISELSKTLADSYSEADIDQGSYADAYKEAIKGKTFTFSPKDASEILHSTGLNVSQFARKYGFIGKVSSQNANIDGFIKELHESLYPGMDIDEYHASDAFMKLASEGHDEYSSLLKSSSEENKNIYEEMLNQAISLKRSGLYSPSDLGTGISDLEFIRDGDRVETPDDSYFDGLENSYDIVPELDNPTYEVPSQEGYSDNENIPELTDDYRTEEAPYGNNTVGAAQSRYQNPDPSTSQFRSNTLSESPALQTERLKGIISQMDHAGAFQVDSESEAKSVQAAMEDISVDHDGAVKDLLENGLRPERGSEDVDLAMQLVIDPSTDSSDVAKLLSKTTEALHSHG